MSYVEDVIKTTETVLSYRIIEVSTGDPAPTPAAGHAINLIFTDLVGLDLYMEYKTFDRLAP